MEKAYVDLNKIKTEFKSKTIELKQEMLRLAGKVFDICR
jgi:hypothetical protein